jgi:hypothetical protein
MGRRRKCRMGARRMRAVYMVVLECDEAFVI